jgi:3-oxoacyl-[acyl-carrier-protein] synthase-1
MKQVFVTGDNIISSLGFTSDENFRNLKAGRTGISLQNDPVLSPSTLPLSVVDSQSLEERFATFLAETGRGADPGSFTRLEQLVILSIHEATRTSGMNFRDNRLLFILSTTKGNIHLLEEKYRLVFDHKRLYLWELARVVQRFFGFANTPIVISNACISGVLALAAGTRQLRTGVYDQVIVTGADLISEFVISGFQSFQSLSPTACKPYDISRDGLTLGEGCGTILLSTEPLSDDSARITVSGSASTNDANHISGPSRTGEELAFCMTRALDESGLVAGEIDFISAHGTATPFNDEMESKAIALSGLLDVPVNSLKGYWGHTLGAAGVIESVATIHCMKEDTLVASAGFGSLGVPEPIRVITRTEHANLVTSLKTASGFGGCNAAIVFRRV